MSEKEISYQEISPTFWQLTKLYWSQFCRVFLLFLPVFAIVFIYGAFRATQPAEDLPAILEIMNLFPNNSILLKYTATFISFYFLQILLFILILGKNYRGFTFTFVPKLDRKSPGYWPMLFYISWAYHWRVMIIWGLLQFVSVKFPQLEEMTSFIGFSTFLQVLTGISFLRFVVNQPYGKVRLSLIEREKSS